MTTDLTALALAIVDFDPEETKRLSKVYNEPYTCLACSDSYVIDVELEPTALCHRCAQEIVPQLAAAVVCQPKLNFAYYQFEDGLTIRFDAIEPFFDGVDDEPACYYVRAGAQYKISVAAAQKLLARLSVAKETS